MKNKSAKFGTMYSILSQIKERLFGSNQISEPKIKSTNSTVTNSGISNVSKVENKSQNTTLNRNEPFRIQIGFDFGTSYSKCIYRDVDKKAAWVYLPSCDNNTRETPFLMSSVVICENKILKLHKNCRIQYPEYGLCNLKFAIVKIAEGKLDDPILKPYIDVAKKHTYKIKQFVDLVAIYYIAQILSGISIHVKENFKGFGQHKNDEMYVTLAIPACHEKDSNVSKYYKELLAKAWVLSKSLLKSEYSIQDFEILVNKATCNQSKIDDAQGICNVYPEVSANMQALILSSASTPQASTIYFFSDTGAGTVDQCAFTYITPQNLNKCKKFNYFASKVMLYGSSNIEKTCIEQSNNKRSREDWCQLKEENPKHKDLQYAVNKVHSLVEKFTYSNTIKELKSKLPTDKEGNVNPISALKEHTRIIFGGGGHIDHPYKKAVIDAFIRTCGIEEKYIKIIAIPMPEDLHFQVKSDKEKWIKRLYVAYGLSIFYLDLAKCEYHGPVENGETSTNKNRTDCTCRGINKDCTRCNGQGSYEL